MIRRPRKRMTLALLKRHIDRRFATKADLRQFATKRDLRRFATKADLRFATKEDVAALEARMGAGFAGVARQLDSLNQKIDAVLDYAKGETRLHTTVLGEHENRLRDLEAGAIG